MQVVAGAAEDDAGNGNLAAASGEVPHVAPATASATLTVSMPESVLEGTDYEVTVTLAGELEDVLTGDLTFRVKTKDGTANSNPLSPFTVDFYSENAVQTVPVSAFAGQSSVTRTYTVDVLSDNIFEAKEETFEVVLSEFKIGGAAVTASDGLSISDLSGGEVRLTAKIADDDSLTFGFRQAAGTVAEGGTVEPVADRAGRRGGNGGGRSPGRRWRGPQRKGRTSPRPRGRSSWMPSTRCSRTRTCRRPPRTRTGSPSRRWPTVRRKATRPSRSC